MGQQVREQRALPFLQAAYPGWKLLQPSGLELHVLRGGA